MATRKKAEKAPGEVRTIEYLPPGVKPDVQRDDPSLDPALEEIREQEIKANDVDISGSREEPSIAPELVEARDEQIKRETDLANGEVAVSDDAEPKPVAKKATAKKSSK